MDPFVAAAKEIGVGSALAMALLIWTVIVYRSGAVPAFVERYKLRTKQLSEGQTRQLDTIIQKVNGEAIKLFAQRLVVDASFITALGPLLDDHLLEAQEGIETRLIDSTAFKERFFAGAHVVKNLQSAQSGLVSLFKEQLARANELDERATRVEANMASMKDESLRTADRIEERMDVLHAETRREVNKLTAEVKEQTGEFKAVTGEFRRVLETLERRKVPRS